MNCTIHDVGHGLCISIRDAAGQALLWDCGHGPNGRPSDFLPKLGINEILCLTVTNYDEDHISDLPELLWHSGIRIDRLCRNHTISPSELQLLKLEAGPIRHAMETLLKMMKHYSVSCIESPMDGLARRDFCNRFGDDFDDTNNNSVVSFVNVGPYGMLIPGDLEKPGWGQLLLNPSFRAALSGVNVFVASHHGRENGYLPEVFEHAKPRVVVFSDDHVKYATQETSDKYRRHASGVWFRGRQRYVLTTRSDGDIELGEISW